MDGESLPVIMPHRIVRQRQRSRVYKNMEEKKRSSGPRCIMFGCSHTSQDGFFVHIMPGKMPSEMEKFSSVQIAWLNFIAKKRKMERKDFRQYKHIVLCSGHFREADYKFTEVKMFQMGIRTKTPSLCAEAVPTVIDAVHPFPPSWFIPPSLGPPVPTADSAPTTQGSSSAVESSSRSSRKADADSCSTLKHRRSDSAYIRRQMKDCKVGNTRKTCTCKFQVRQKRSDKEGVQEAQVDGSSVPEPTEGVSWLPVKTERNVKMEDLQEAEFDGPCVPDSTYGGLWLPVKTECNMKMEDSRSDGEEIFEVLHEDEKDHKGSSLPEDEDDISSLSEDEDVISSLSEDEDDEAWVAVDSVPVASSSKSKGERVSHMQRQRSTVFKRKWSMVEKAAVWRHFASNIKSGQLPRRVDIDKAMELEPVALKDRTWTTIKFYIRNQIRKPDQYFITDAALNPPQLWLFL